MKKVEEAKEILKLVKLPKINDLSGYVLLALSNLREYSNWENATNDLYTTRDIMDFLRDEYNIDYKANTRETVRKDVLHYFLNSAIVEANRDKPDRATNSPKFCYSLTNEFLELINKFKNENWDNEVKTYNKNSKSLVNKYESEREFNRVPVTINEESLSFGPGKHNKLQKAIIEEFAERFAPGAEVLYVGDTENKNLVKNTKKLEELGFLLKEHEKLPDVILYLESKNWIYFIEAVTSVGPMSDKRVIEIKEMMKNCYCAPIFVTAFLDRTTFKKFISDLAWETEVWLSEEPDHMIHLNGDRFMGPR